MKFTLFVTHLGDEGSVVQKWGSLLRHDTCLNPDPNPYTILSLSVPFLYPWPYLNPYPDH